MSRNVMVAKQVNKFIKYCQKNSIDKYAIDTYGQAVFYNFDTTIIRFFSSNNHPYCMLIYDSNTYIFRYKDKVAFIALNDLKSPADGLHKRTSDYSISREEIDACSFNYKDIETTATVNGKRLKFCLDTSQWDELYFYTFDDSTCLRLMSLNIYGKGALNVNGHIRIYLIISNNYLYCMYELFDKQYIFKFKNRQTIDIFTKYHNPVNFNKDITYLFDYKSNENTTIVNGHCLKSFCGNYKNITAIQCFYTYDTESCLNLICTDINEITAGWYIQEIIGKFKELKDYNIRGCLWDITNNVPEALKDLVISQKVMLSMLTK